MFQARVAARSVETSALIKQIESHAAAMTVLTNRLNQIEQSQENLIDHATSNPQSAVEFAPQPSTTTG